jgi:hypothetical protein
MGVIYMYRGWEGYEGYMSGMKYVKNCNCKSRKENIT